MGDVEAVLQALRELSARTVTVQGEGSVDVAPDAATIRLGVYVTHKNLKKARAEAAAQATGMIAAVKDAGIKGNGVQTSGYVVTPLRQVDEKTKTSAIAGYDVRNTISVTVRDLERLPAVLDAATAAGANQVSGPFFFLQHPEQAEADAQRLAMANARRTAETLAAAGGEALGQVRSIVHGEQRGGPMPRMAFMARADAAPTTPIEAGVETVRASVEVVWDLAATD